jgi:2-C-methyl-D-erythritol 4-phosphate cytidylyltransferase
MGATSSPKQYLPLAGRTVIEWSLDALMSRADVARIVVVIARGDAWWSGLAVASSPKLATATGGAERIHSVLSGLDALASVARSDDWVLVHDAARPCLSAADLDRLIDTLRDDEVGGLLAAPVVDTIKRTDGSDRVLDTVPRDLLWRALTPQMFRFELLKRALDLAVEQKIAATDESQAIEALGRRPRLIEGDADNIKITAPGDLERAARILETRARRREG